MMSITSPKYGEYQEIAAVWSPYYSVSKSSSYTSWIEETPISEREPFIIAKAKRGKEEIVHNWRQTLQQFYI
jgi:hypothetical protein